MAWKPSIHTKADIIEIIGIYETDVAAFGKELQADVFCYNIYIVFV